MPKEEWGVKRLCPHCASRFYDLTKDPMTCPVCNATFSAESLVSSRGRSLVSEKSSQNAEEEVVADDLTDDDDIDSDASDDAIDDDLLDDDDDDNVSLDEIADVASNDDDS
ncbi:FYDLN acid domain-containing protein [Albirhodobacter sp. R86504]|uniref:FYDLN acid domain-containing protein n=1 Tax=Albirhodobacter sp. R86504 TaxID=3093848 RepID=UPI00366E4CB6